MTANDADAPYHAHIYYAPAQRPVALALRDRLRSAASCSASAGRSAACARDRFSSTLAKASSTPSAHSPVRWPARHCSDSSLIVSIADVTAGEEAALVEMDFYWVAENRDRILAEWQKRYGAKDAAPGNSGPRQRIGVEKRQRQGYESAEDSDIRRVPQ